MQQLFLPPRKKVYFASDFHLGAPSFAESRKREDMLVSWLETIRADAAHVFLMGDLFDFWYEYRTVVPKGFLRFFGKLAQLADAGIPITIFTGNHDMWMFGYLDKELGVTVRREPLACQIGEHSFYLAHGDGLGPGDHFYKKLKRIFENKTLRWLYRWLHPDVGLSFGFAWAAHSRKKKINADLGFKGDDEWLWQYAHSIEQQQHHDYYVFGHRHLPLNLAVGDESRYLNLGEWLTHYTYAVYDGEMLQLKKYSPMY